MFIRLATDEQKRDIGLKRNCDPPTDRLTDLSSPLPLLSFLPTFVLQHLRNYFMTKHHDHHDCRRFTGNI